MLCDGELSVRPLISPSPDFSPDFPSPDFLSPDLLSPMLLFHKTRDVVLILAYYANFLPIWRQEPVPLVEAWR